MRKQNVRPSRDRLLLTPVSRKVAIGIALMGAALTIDGCQSTAQVSRPCGVITDSLFNVQATTPDGNRRLSDHDERGIRAGCWKRGQ